MDRILHTTHGNPGRGYYPQNKVELPKDSVVDIVSADRVSDYVLAIKFSDDHESRVDFQIFLTNSRSPHIRSYLDLKRFNAFRIETVISFGAITRCVFLSRICMKAKFSLCMMAVLPTHV